MSGAATRLVTAFEFFTDVAGKQDHVQFLRLKKLKGKNIVLTAAKHNKREGHDSWRGADRIDRSRSSLNYVLAGPQRAREVQELYRGKLRDAGLRSIRKDAVMAVEAVVSVPVAMSLDHRAYFEAALRFLALAFGGPANVLCADVHRDEACPHMHVLIAPLFDGRLQGSDAVGGPGDLARLLDWFYVEVSARFGFRRS